MQEVYEFLKACGTYYLATLDGSQPRVRPFGTVDLYDGKLTIQTGRSKDVSRQMLANPRWRSVPSTASAGCVWPPRPWRCQSCSGRRDILNTLERFPAVPLAAGLRLENRQFPGG